eukprot:scaffold160461_cov18-Prasinocladus_malaysianus.AAC.1
MMPAEVRRAACVGGYVTDILEVTKTSISKSMLDYGASCPAYCAFLQRACIDAHREPNAVGWWPS